jgi:hypothetical protein
MPFTHSHGSFSEWKEQTWECFFLLEKSFPLSKRFELNDFFPITEKILRLIFSTSSVASLPYDQLIQYALFVMFLLKSTLYFDRSFSADMQQKDSKLILMHADLYLVQGGIEFSKIHEHKQCQILLDETLNFIATNYQVTYNRKNLSSTLISTLSNRYGALVYCAIAGLFLVSGKSVFPEKLLYSFSRSYGLLLCLEHHELLSLSQRNSPTLLNYSLKVLSILNDNSVELSFLGHLSSDIERKGQNDFIGW